MPARKTVKKPTLEQLPAFIKKRDELIKKRDDVHRRAKRFTPIGSFSLDDYLNGGVEYTKSQLVAKLTEFINNISHQENDNEVIFFFNPFEYDSGVESIKKYEVGEVDVSKEITKLETQIASVDKQIEELERALLDSLKVKYEQS